MARKNIYSIGDTIDNIQNGMVCTTYPLTDFKKYNGQERNNNISCGVVIDITPKHVLLPTVLVEKNGFVVAVRVPEYFDIEKTQPNIGDKIIGITTVGKMIGSYISGDKFRTKDGLYTFTKWKLK